MKLLLIIRNIFLIPKKIMNRQSIFSVVRDSVLTGRVALASGAKVYWSKIGNMSYVGNKTRIFNTVIENYCSIGENCLIGAANHELNFISTSPVFNSGKNILRKNIVPIDFNPFTKKTIIENDVWIGANCLIKQGVTIKNGAVIGMGAVLTHDVGSYEIWAGNPAKKIGQRFNDEEIKELEKSMWWELSEKELINFLNTQEILKRGK